MASGIILTARRNAAPATFYGSATDIAYRLGAPIAKGGEGIVYALAGAPDHVAKVYHRRPTADEADKIDALMTLGSPSLLSMAAMPVDRLSDVAGHVVGFVMPRIDKARSIHDLYSPRGRQAHFANADFRFLVHVSVNITRLFAAVHEHGFIIGDVNHGNILVRADGTVAAIDCDSFQIGDGSRFRCRVGVELFTPPELQGQRLADIARTPN